jgi:hypothetical protein
LGDEGGAGRANRVPFERFVHPLVRAVLLRLGGKDALVLNAQPQRIASPLSVLCIRSCAPFC